MDAIEHFAADVAHELKNPLTSLRSATETLPVVRTDIDRARLIEIIQSDVGRLDRLISDILAASRLDAELSRDETSSVDMLELLRAVVSVSEGEAAQIGVVVQLLVVNDEGNYELIGHELRLGQVVNNLIDNAISFSDENDGVRITLRRTYDTILVSIDDDGPGMAPDALERIFERFYTDRPGADAFGKNSGLGLSIAKQIIEAHGGSIIAANRCDNNGAVVGARFEVQLPALAAS
jgi:two-component system sensor histidine kinase ChvG